LPEKLLCNQLSLYRFSVAVGTFIVLYHVATDLKIENLVLEIWFLITQLRKSTLGYSRTLPEASWLSNLEHLPYSSEVFYSHYSCCCQQGTSHLAEVDRSKLLPASFSKDMYVIHLYYDYAVSLTRLSVQLHTIVCNMQQIVWQNVFVQTL